MSNDDVTAPHLRRQFYPVLLVGVALLAPHVFTMALFRCWAFGGYKMDHEAAEDAMQGSYKKKCEDDVEHRSTLVFSNLPVEMQLRVFSYLPLEDRLMRAALVCKDWEKLVWDQSLWAELTMDAHDFSLERATQLVTCAGDRIKKVRLVRWEETRADQVVEMLTLCVPELESLALNRCWFDSCDTLENVAYRCKALKELNCWRIVIPLESRHILDIFAGSPTLEKLALTSYCYGLVRHVERLKLVGRDWPKLTDIRLEWGEGDKDLELEVVTAAVGKQLRVLRVADFKNPKSLQLIRHCRVLEDLSITMMGDMPLRHLQIGIATLPILSRLYLGCMTGSTAQEIITFFSTTPVVRRLEYLGLSLLSNLNDHALSVIGSSCPRLTRITISSCWLITADGLLQLLSSCSKLQILRINHCAQLTSSSCWDTIETLHPALCVKVFDNMDRMVKWIPGSWSASLQR